MKAPKQIKGSHNGKNINWFFQRIFLRVSILYMMIYLVITDIIWLFKTIDYLTYRALVYHSYFVMYEELITGV